jgi:hypothetical protein
MTGMTNAHRHWPVFWASFAILLVTWGLVPVQAGIFSVETIERSSEVPFAVSTSFMPANQQTTNLTLRYSQSTYGIATLNETLPPYMARNYTLAPFRPSQSMGIDDIAIQGTWTTTTTMYSVDLYCEVSSPIRDAEYMTPGSVLYKSNGGCNVTTGLSGNVTKGYIKNKNIYAPLLELKDYMAMYIGYYNGYNADYSLDGHCPPERNSTFYAAFSRTKVSCCAATHRTYHKSNLLTPTSSKERQTHRTTSQQYFASQPFTNSVSTPQSMQKPSHRYLSHSGAIKSHSRQTSSTQHIWRYR